MHIRAATELDSDDVREIHWHAFPESERQLVAKLAVDLLAENTTPQTFALVAEVDGELVGHIAFSPLTITQQQHWQGYILAPLGVRPEYQNQRIGAKLIRSGIQRLSAMAVNVLFVYGDPAYYGQFGFDADAASAYSPPYPLQYPFGWLAIHLNEVDLAEAKVTLSCVDSLNNRELW